MRNLFIAAVVLIVAAPLRSGHAQGPGLKESKALRDKSREAPADSDSDDGEAPDNTPAPTPSGGGDQGGKGDGQSASGAPGAEHRVEKGDTLWDLSQRYLGSPWYWPKVWSYNPDIANPHWIYPGNTVRFYNGGEEVPTQVQVGKIEDTDVGDVEESSLLEEPEEKVKIAGHIGYTPKRSIQLAAVPFVTTDEVAAGGHVVGSFKEAQFLTAHDSIYIEYENNRPAKLGEAFVIFKEGKEVMHPITKELMGYETNILGQGHVIRIDGPGRATALLDRAFDAIERGDLIGPAGETLNRSVAARPNDRDVKEVFVVAAAQTYLTVFGENQLLIMDKGTDDGVKPGNTFTIWRQQDGLPSQNFLNPLIIEDDRPREDIAQCIAVEVKSKATTCLVAWSFREIIKGDRAEVRAMRARSDAR